MNNNLHELLLRIKRKKKNNIKLYIMSYLLQ